MDTVIKPPERAGLSGPERLQLDTLAAVGGSGWIRYHAPSAAYALDIPGDPDHPERHGTAAPDGRVACHNVRPITLDALLRLGLIEYGPGQDGDTTTYPVHLTTAGRAVAEPERRRLELAGIAAVTGFPPDVPALNDDHVIVGYTAARPATLAEAIADHAPVPPVGGVHVVAIGEDSDTLITAGHVAPGVMLAACDPVARFLYGETLAGALVSMDRPDAAPEHRYGVLTFPEDQEDECPWHCSWANAETPGAEPITVLDLS
jgi:hypothetical protein